MRAGRADSKTVTTTRQVRAPWAVLAVTVALVGFPLGLAAVLGRPSSEEPWIQDLLFQLVPVPFAVVGALIAARRPGHRIGWLLLGGTLSIAGALFAWSYTLHKLPDGTWLPGRVVVGWVGNWIPWPALAAFLLLLLLFPDGQPPSPRWRPIGWAIVVYCAVIMAFLALYPALISAPDLDNPVALSGTAGKVMRELQSSPVVPAIGIALLVAAASAPLVRFRRARAAQRQQLKWFAYSVALLMAILVVPSFPLPPWAKDLSGILGVVAVWGIAAAIGIAVLRYRLYDIDRIVNRTLVYGLLTALLGGVYAGIVLILGQLFGRIGGQPPTWAVAGATLAVAALFQPARRRIQQAVDRRFNRRRYDLARTVEAFSSRLRDEVDLDTLSAELLAVIDQTMQPTTASLWLRPSAQTPSRTGGWHEDMDQTSAATAQPEMA
jgi:hypothetical protein